MGSQTAETRPAALALAAASFAVRHARGKSAAAAALVAALALAACQTTPAPSPYPAPPPPPPTGAEVQTRDGVTPQFMAGRPVVRIGLLLPFSLRPQDASALYSAAELALFDHGDANTLLIPRDAGSDKASAGAAAGALMTDGADIIIGPVLREGVEGAAEQVRSENIPVIGFSSDRTVAGNGVYLLSFQLEDEVSRLVSYAASRNIRSIALLAPANEYGRRVEQALRAQARARGLSEPLVALYTRNETEAAGAATRLAQLIQASPDQAVLIADNGAPLRAIGGAFAQAGVRPQLMGTSAWAGDAEREPTLAGGWYVASDPTLRQDFERRYQNTYSREPTRLASLAYDAVALVALLSRDRGAQGFTRTALENSQGYLGSDGIFRFRADGSIERGLAIMQVGSGGATTIDAAPSQFPGPPS